MTLDDTYKRILHEISKVNRVHAHRLLQGLAVAVRPLRVQELAEVLAIEFSETEGIPKLDEDLRWQDQEQAVLSACSSLIAVVDFRNSRIVQFSHYTVKEFLTSNRLAASMLDPLRDHHILLEPAHTTMAKACVGVLLCLEQPINNEMIKRFPLADYAAKHFADHAEFGNVISHIKDGIDDLLDADKPHFAVWMSHISSSWWAEKDFGTVRGSPLYHVADLGFHGLVQHLIMRQPPDVFARGGGWCTWNPGACSVAQETSPSLSTLTPALCWQGRSRCHWLEALARGGIECTFEATRMTIELGADINACDDSEWTPPQEDGGCVASILSRHGCSSAE